MIVLVVALFGAILWRQFEPLLLEHMNTKLMHLWHKLRKSICLHYTTDCDATVSII